MRLVFVSFSIPLLISLTRTLASDTTASLSSTTVPANAAVAGAGLTNMEVPANSLLQPLLPCMIKRRSPKDKRACWSKALRDIVLTAFLHPLVYLGVLKDSTPLLGPGARSMRRDLRGTGDLP